MLPESTVPPSFAALLATFRPCFTAPTFRTFCALVYGMLAGSGRRTVCGMLVGAGLSRAWRHHRAHRFFSRAAWSPDELGLALVRLVVGLLVPEGQPVTVAVDDTLYHRSGHSVHAASWFHDGSATSTTKAGFGNNWVIAGIVLTIPLLGRVVCLLVLARLVCTGTVDASRRKLATQMMTKTAENLPGRMVHGVGDAAYAGKELCSLPENVTWTTRVRTDADLSKPAPPERSQAPHAGTDRRRAHLHPRHRDPLREDHHRLRSRPHLPVARGFQLQTRAVSSGQCTARIVLGQGARQA
ncbi:transposase [Frankia sp. CiP3]|uniref:transposase n=1 Tax=Frankia sp. CiP3 TaxID=2880971 RepID=UPI001EF4E197|nr:transposase [Frankia sp. CiP3]